MQELIGILGFSDVMLTHSRWQAWTEGGATHKAALGPHILGPPKFIRSPSRLISLAQQLLIKFYLISKSNFSKSFKQTRISSLKDEAKKMYSSRLSIRPC